MPGGFEREDFVVDEEQGPPPIPPATRSPLTGAAPPCSESIVAIVPSGIGAPDPKKVALSASILTTKN